MTSERRLGGGRSAEQLGLKESENRKVKTFRKGTLADPQF